MSNTLNTIHSTSSTQTTNMLTNKSKRKNCGSDVLQTNVSKYKRSTDSYTAQLESLIFKNTDLLCNIMQNYVILSHAVKSILNLIQLHTVNKYMHHIAMAAHVLYTVRLHQINS
jgi:uncharacterized membrane-anchored protein YhcB (DUF1043 family)